ncbi:hypothetical protein [Candidatus Electronema sp. PJ]|uniref:hypothetical protein n=1 Tax=Candidatus Electronema sp. PJ TaxID=3401572 RepID=UPI003AA81F1E
MVQKICLFISFAGILLTPLKSANADFAVFDQFADALNTGMFQGVQVSSEMNIESSSDDGSTQGINVIVNPSYRGNVMQVTLMEQDFLLTLSEGDKVVQGVNVYRGSADSVTQMVAISGSVTMSSRNNTDSIQGINVITDCDSCN